MDPFERVLGNSVAAQNIRSFGRRAAAVDAPVLLLGESGTGKGILARAIHDASPRARQSFVSVNCAAVPESLFESEFFGHVRGAFTGAQYAHKGLFEQAEHGTLFLDEVGELPLSMQAKLLTTIEDRQVRRVGGERVAQLDVRIIAATACDLISAAACGRFRADLYHRLSVLGFRLAPLRERSEDVHELAHTFLQMHCERYERGVCVFDADTLQLLTDYAWPGNIRELSNAIESAVVAATDTRVCIAPDLLRPDLYVSRPNRNDDVVMGDERARILAALRESRGNRAQAARALGMARTTLWQKLKRLDIRTEQIEPT